MIVVVDASVALKWFFNARDDESHVDTALDILKGIDIGNIQMVQPPHFVAEVAAVLAREKQEGAHADLEDLQRLEWDVIQDARIYSTAVKLSVNSGQHLFDTLYHATALQIQDAILVTADERYFEKAAEVGSIVRLGDFRLPE